MPVKPLPSNPSLDHLRHQAKDLLKGLAAHRSDVAQRLREFHPRFREATDAQLFAASLRLSDAQFAIARERGFPSWPSLKAFVETPALASRMSLPHHERIDDGDFRRAVDLLDAGDANSLRALLKQNPDLARRRVAFPGGNYFQNPALLEFVAENPVRHGTLPGNIVEVAQVILDAHPEASAVDETLGLVSTGRVPRESRAQVPLIELLCGHGADPNRALQPAASHGEFAAVSALIHRGARMTLPVAAALGDLEEFRRLLPVSTADERHGALALAAQFGHTEIVRLLLEAGEDPNRYNPPGFHSHSTPLHQAALAGHDKVVRLLVERNARLDLKDTIWQGVPAGWAEHGGHPGLAAYLRAQETAKERTNE